MNTVVWQSEETQLQILARRPRFSDIFDQFLHEHEGAPVTLILNNGDRIPVILVSGSQRLLTVRRFAKAERLIIPKREVIGIVTE